eukprot:UN12359
MNIQIHIVNQKFGEINDCISTPSSSTLKTLYFDDILIVLYKNGLIGHLHLILKKKLKDIHQ